MARVGLNAHLLNLTGNYRSAGINWFIYHLLQNLPADDALDYIAFLGDARAREHFPQVRLARSRLPTHQPATRILWEQFVLPFALKKEKINLLHALAFAGPQLIAVPWIVTVYDLSFRHYPASFPRANRLYLEWAVRNAVRRATRVIAISESTKRDLIAAYGIPAGRVRVIYCGRSQHFSPAADIGELERWRAAQGAPAKFILHVGTLEPRKNTAQIIRAFARAKRAAKLPQQLVLIGARGWKYDGVDRAIEAEGIARDVIFAGYVPPEQLPNWYRAADAFIYPSLYEGFGLPPLEAMACGTPVITSNVSSLPEVVGDAALQVNPHDTEMLADALTRVVTDRALAADLRARGLAQAEKFSWQRAGQATAQLYRELLT